MFDSMAGSVFSVDVLGLPDGFGGALSADGGPEAVVSAPEVFAADLCGSA